MSELDKLQTAAHGTKDGLDNAITSAANLEKSADGVAQQFAALGSNGTAQILTSAKGQLGTAQEHLARAKKALDEFASGCEQAKGNG